MILKKPYAFFIKIFKPIHLVLSLLILYLITLNNKILTFFNEYLGDSVNVVGQELNETLINSFVYIIPVIIIIFSMIVMGIMLKKQKPITFYFITIFSFIIILVINVYTDNFIKTMEQSIVAVKSVKLIHDFVLINIGIESLIFVLYFVRGLGLNFKKFDFDSDILKLDLNDKDNEEFEFNINIDINDTKRKRKERFRKFKYTYVENKFIINISIIILSLLIFIISGAIYYNTYININVEGKVYNVSNLSIKVNSTTILNEDYQGNKLTKEDNSLIVVDINTKYNYGKNDLELNDFNLKIENIKIKPTNKYSKRLLDLGNMYDISLVKEEFMDFIIVYEVPNKYINSDMVLLFKSFEIKLKPIDIKSSDDKISKNIKDSLDFKNTIGDISFKIDNYEIQDKFLINYNYCIKKDDCILSKEYLKPSINTNFTKSILKLKLEYSNNSDLKIKTFYDLLSKFGYISYSIDGKWYNQMANFEQINSKRVDLKEEYIGINSNIKNAEYIKFVFDIRDYKYEYILKG